MRVLHRIAAVIAVVAGAAAISVSTGHVAQAATFQPPGVDGWSWGE